MKTRGIIILISVILMFINKLYAQNETKGQQAWVIKYDLISLLGDQVSNSMGVRMGLEWMNTEKKCLAADIMYIFPCPSCGEAYTRVETEKTVGFLISGANRYYLFTGSSPFSGFHLGPQLAYQWTKADMAETNNGIPNTYQVYRNMFTAHAMTGYQVKIAGPFFFDPSIGLGVRYISSRNENKQGTGEGQYEYLYNKEYDSGARWFFSFDFGIKLGIKL